MDSWVVVSRADGSTVRHRIEGENATVGKSPTAGIPLVNCEELMDEHLMVTPRPDGCWVAVHQKAFPKVTLKGREVTGETVPWGGELAIGSITLVVTDKLTAIRKTGDQKKVGPVGILAFLMIPIVGWLILGDDQGGLPDGPGTPPPELFDPAGECATDGPPPAEIAREAAEGGSRRAERYPFRAQDGVRAVALYGTAEVCYAAAGRNADSARIGRVRSALTRRLEEDYRSHRLRLERAMELQHFDDALIAVKDLNDMLSHRSDDDYVKWLDLLQQRLQLMVDMSLSASS